MLWHRLMAQPILLLVAHTTCVREKRGSGRADIKWDSCTSKRNGEKWNCRSQQWSCTLEWEVSNAFPLRFGFGLVTPFIKEICRSTAFSAIQYQHFQSTNLLNNSKLHLHLTLWTFPWRGLLTEVTEVCLSSKKFKCDAQRPSDLEPRTIGTFVYLSLPSFVWLRDCKYTQC